MSLFCCLKKKKIIRQVKPADKHRPILYFAKPGRCFAGGRWGEGGAGGVNNLIFSLKSTYNPFKKLLFK